MKINKKISFDDDHIKISDLLKTHFTETVVSINTPAIDHHH